MQILQTIWTALTTENEGLVALINVPLSFIEAYLIMLIFIKLFTISASKKQQLIYVISFSVLGCFIRFLIDDPYGTLVNFILCPILLMIIFKSNILKCIFGEILSTIILAIIDLILMKIFTIFKISTYQILNIPIYKLISSIFEYTFLYLAYKYLLITSFSINLQGLRDKKQNILLTLNAIFGLITIFTQMYIYCYHTNTLPQISVFISIISLVVYFIISLYSLISTSKLNIAKQNLEETRLMNKTLTILNDKIRAFRHDFNNIIQALGGYIQAKDMDGLEKYYSQLLKDCQEVTNLSGLNPKSINNPAIYSLLASKYYLATEKGIEFNLDIFMDLNSIDMKIYEFCRILGILLDNAIQATQECEEKQITVTIRKDNRCKRQLLIVENTYKEKDIDTEKIFEKGYSTKEGNTGLGLWEVRQILLKNTNLNLFTSKDAKYFKQQLEIYKS